MSEYKKKKYTVLEEFHKKIKENNSKVKFKSAFKLYKLDHIA